MGIGIFLGLCFCGVIYLYTQTKDRWNWSKLGKILSYVVITPIVLGLVFWGGLFLYPKYEERPKIITSYKGVKLGDSLNDVNFKLGKFQKIDSLGEFLFSELKGIKKDTPEYLKRFKSYQEVLETEKKFNKGTVDYYKSPIGIRVKDNKIVSIWESCPDDDFYSSVNGIRCNSSGDEILQKFPDDVRILCQSDIDSTVVSFDGYQYRVYDTIKYGVRYKLKQNKVTKLMILDPKILESYFEDDFDRWIKCE